MFAPLAFLFLVPIILFHADIVNGVVPAGICADGTPACRAYADQMCPKDGGARKVNKKYETYAFCCCRKTCDLCKDKDLAKNVRRRFKNADDKSSYDWSGQEWLGGRGKWRHMNSNSFEWENPFEGGGGFGNGMRYPFF